MLNNSPDNWAKCGWSGAASGSVVKKCFAEQHLMSWLTRVPTLMLWASMWALRSLLTRFCPRNFFRNLVLYLRLSPQTPHCHASRCWMPGESSHVHLSMRPELHALASAWVSAAEDTASRKAVSLKAGGEEKLLEKNPQKCLNNKQNWFLYQSLVIKLTKICSFRLFVCALVFSPLGFLSRGLFWSN